MNDQNPGAGGKGSAGYWGYSTDESKEDQFEKFYRLRIPKNRYKTTTHNPLTCGKCTNSARTIHVCLVSGTVGLGELPLDKAHIRNKLIERCNYCRVILRSARTAGKPKSNPKIAEKSQ